MAIISASGHSPSHRVVSVDLPMLSQGIVHIIEIVQTVLIENL